MPFYCIIIIKIYVQTVKQAMVSHMKGYIESTSVLFWPQCFTFLYCAKGTVMKDVMQSGWRARAKA